MYRLSRLAVFGILAALSAHAADLPIDFGPDPENFVFQVTGSIWTRDSHGSLFDAHTTLDLVRDLGADQDVDTFYGGFVFKPGYHHRILIEGTPLSLDGQHDAVETFVYAGKRFTLHEPLDTSAGLSYIFGGYQYDFVCGRRGHVGAAVGGAYMNATGTVTAPDMNIDATRSQRLAIPLAGVEGRVYPIRDRTWLEVDGRFRGMEFGSYGHYAEFGANVGFWFRNKFAVQAGYRDLSTLLQNNGRLNAGLDLHLTGPIFSLSFKL